MRHRQVLEKFLGALVGVEQAQLQIKHGLARHAKEKMARLDDARVHWADRHLENAFAFDRAEFVALALEWRGLSGAGEIFAGGVNPPPVIMGGAPARTWMVNQVKAEQCPDLAGL